MSVVFEDCLFGNRETTLSHFFLLFLHNGGWENKSPYHCFPKACQAPLCNRLHFRTFILHTQSKLSHPLSSPGNTMVTCLGQIRKKWYSPASFLFPQTCCFVPFLSKKGWSASSSLFFAGPSVRRHLLLILFMRRNTDLSGKNTFPIDVVQRMHELRNKCHAVHLLHVPYNITLTRSKPGVIRKW